MNDFEAFAEQVETAANKVNLKQSVATKRTGAASARDKIVFGKFSWQEALSFVAIIQSIIIFTALIPDAVGTINNMFAWLGIPFEFPIEISSLGAVLFIIFVFIFGLVAVRHIGTIKRSNEITTKMNPGMFLLWKRQEEIMKKLEEKNE